MTINTIYNGWAFTSNEREKAKSNVEAYKELCEKYKILKIPYGREPSQEELNENDIVYSRKACYNHGEYIVYKKTEEVINKEILLILDGGNLCFGGKNDYGNHYTIFED